MAANLGQLTLDLIAKIGGFTGPMDQASRISEKRMKEISKHASAAGKAIGAAATIVAGAGAVWIKSAIDTAAEVSRLAQVSNASTTEFQKAAYAAQSVGIEQDKLADIFKDVNDKVGDFLVNGAGPLADFFDKVAPQVGVTAEQFRNLSGPKALGLYVDTLEKAGANQQEMTFFMEAIAGDATALIPLLQSSGEKMRGLATEAENLGIVMSDEAIKGAKQFNDDLATLGRVVNSVGQNIAAELLPELTELTKELRDPETAKAAAAMAKAVVGSFTDIINGAKNTVKFIQWAAESAAAFMNGIAADDLVRLNDELDRLQKMKASGALDRLVFFGRDGIVEYYDDEELDAEIAKIQGAIQAAMNSGPPVTIPVEPILSGGSSSGTGLNIPPSPTGNATKAAREAVDAIQSQIDALKVQAATLEMTTKDQTLYKLALDGATQSQLDQAAAALDAVDAFDKAKKQQEEYKSLVSDLRTEEEQLTDQLKERLRIIEAMPGLPDAERREQASRAVGAAFTDAPQFQGIDASIAGPAGEFMKLNDAEKELEDWYQTQLEMLGKFREERADLTAEWDEQELELKRQHEEALAGIEKNRQLVSLSAAETTFGSLAEMAKTFAGEQSGLYKALFLAEKAAAIARATIAIQEGIALAAANPFPANLAAMASVAAATAGIVGNIAAIGMAHDGIDSVPKTGTWLLEKGERVTTAGTSAKLDATLSRIQAGMNEQGGARGGRASGGITVNQTNNYNGRGDNRTASQANSDLARKMRITEARLGR
ncbi:phage tail tape measure protein [Ectopseudomonas khazarica]|uniref:phage tail tape measure protein n=1 Tax=Ectopseudomonas khazarica TaxID=2502979 RepID=UPI003B9567E5